MTLKQKVRGALPLIITLIVIILFKSYELRFQWNDISSQPILKFNQTLINEFPDVQKFFNRSIRVKIADKDRNGTSFIHIGKTGGSSISRMLRNGCHSFISKPCPGRVIPNETIASFIIKDYYHVTKIPYNESSRFVITIRNPIHRVTSAFLYHHPKNVRARSAYYKKMANLTVADLRNRISFAPPNTRLLYQRCFSTLRDFVISANGQNVSNTFSCPNKTSIVRDALLGKDKRMQHMYRNYKHYVGPMPSSTEVFVLRKEHLNDDWIKLNSIFQKEHEHNDASQINYTDIHSIDYEKKESFRNESDKAPLQNDLTSSETQMLCPYLQEDIQLYISLLNRAVNLSDRDVLESLQDIFETCPNFLSKFSEPTK